MKNLLVSAIITQMFVTAFSIKCYQCNSITDEGCLSLSDFKPHLTASYYKECADLDLYNGSKPFCRKDEVEIKHPQNAKRTIRTCGWLALESYDRDCTSRDFEGHIEVKCQCYEDGCNGSSQMKIFSILTFAVVNVVLFIAYN